MTTVRPDSVAEEEQPAHDMAGFVHQMQARAVGADRFVFEDGSTGRRMFGGITLAQALVAAAQTVDGLAAHELHTLFLRPHVPGDEVIYEVERLRDGRRFSTRRVRAVEGGRLLNESTVSFVAAGQGATYLAPPPPAPEPNGLPAFFPSSPATYGDGGTRRTGYLFDQRLVRWTGPQPHGANELHLWARAVGVVPDTPVLQAAALAALSDISSQVLGLQPDDESRPDSATLNHTLWIHSVPAFDGWLLFLRESPVAVQGRVFMTGAIYTRDGVRCASLAQESLLATE